jgi:ABC-2 type transport system ATP-binding protein
MPQRADYYSDFTAREHLRWLGLIGGGSGAALEQQVEQLLGRMGLAEHAEGRLATYSPGLLQRVGLAQVLLSDPEVLLLDEPVASLDPDGQTDFEALIHEWRTQGKTCVITSNNLDEAARIATHIGILKDGLLADFREWSTEELVHTFSLSVPPLSPEVQQALAEWDVTYHAEAGELLVTSPSDHVPPALLRTLLDHDVTPRAVTPQGPSLPEVYHSALQSSDE